MTDLEHQAARLYTLICEEADDYPLHKLTRSTSLRRDLNLSGIQRLSMILRLEAEFGIELSDAEWDAIVHPHSTVSDVWAAVERHLAKVAA